MSTLARFDGYDIALRYGTDYACYLVLRHQPQTVRLCTTQVEVALGIVTRLGWLKTVFYVENEAIVASLAETLSVEAIVYTGQETVDTAVILFNRQTYAQPPVAKRLVIMAHNRWSYKTLLYPRLPKDSVLQVRQWIAQAYQIDQYAGIFTPPTLATWVLATLIGTRHSPSHYKWSQKALDNMIDISPWWQFGYLIIVAGDRRDE